jgi:hypothetical protein
VEAFITIQAPGFRHHNMGSGKILREVIRGKQAMKFVGVRLLVFILASILPHLLLVKTLTVAAPMATVQARFALVIGNAAYPDSPLRNPVNDATDMATLLGNLGFTVTLLTNADQRTMERAIQEFTKGVPGGSLGLFFFAGHGVQIDGMNYLLPIGGDYNEPSDVKYRAVVADWVLARMEEAGMDMKLLILDACRDNPFGRRWTRALSRGLATMDALQGALIAYATSPGKTAADGTGRNSPYTAQLLRHMRVPELPVERMFKVVRQGVQRETNGRQTPWESSSLTGEFYFGGLPSTDLVRQGEPLELGGLSIIGRVSGAEVWVEDDKIGETKAGRGLTWENLKPGVYRLRAQRSGYEPWERQVKVSANQRTEVVIDMKLLPEPSVERKEEPLEWGGLSIIGRVSGAEVWVEEDKIGETKAGRALTWENLKPGVYRLRAQRPGYEPWERQVQVSANQRTEVVIDLTPLPELGALAITGRVAGAEVWVDDDRLGETTAGRALVRDNLKPGSYHVKAYKPGYRPWEQDVQITANQHTEVVIDLTPLPELGGLAITGRVAGAEVWVGNDRLGETTAGGALVWDNLKPGSYRVKVYKPGYRPWERQVQVSASQRTEVVIDLTPLPELGGLALTGRVAGAEVWLGTEKLGETRLASPLVRDNLPPGNYRVKVRKAGYQPWEQEVQVTANQRTEVVIDLTPLPGSVAISSRVAGAEVWLGTEKLGETKLASPLVRNNLPPGSYRVKAQKPGYQPWEQEIQVSANQRIEVVIDLTPLPGTIAITGRVAGVEVWVGSDKLGETVTGSPLIRDNLPPGSYRVKALKSGYQPWEQEVQVNAGQRTDVGIDLTPLPGTVAISSRVAGAEVWVGADKLGETMTGSPLVRDNLPPGSYRVKAQKPGYQPWEQEIQVSANQRIEVVIDLTPLPGTIAITGRVAGVEVWVGSDKLGETATRSLLIRDNLPPGSYRVKGLKSGYQPWEQEVQVTANQRTEVVLDLTPLPGSVAITSRVAGVEVWVGTNKLGETRLGSPLVRDNLPPGSYRVKAQKPGYQPWEQEVQVTANQRTEVVLDLTPLRGTVAISSRVAGVEVWVGSDKLGETATGSPLIRDNLPPGSYRVKAQKPGYQPWEQEVQITADKRTDVAIDLTPLPGTVAITSRVAGVEVWVGNDKLGETRLGTPLVRDKLPPGNYRIKAQKPGYQPWERDIQISADQRIGVGIDLTPLPGSVSIIGRVAGTEVWMGTDKLGETGLGNPLVWDNLPPGSYRVKALKSGYQPWEQEVKVTANQRTEVVIDLTPLPELGTLVITGRVAGAEVWVGTNKIGKTTAASPLIRDNLTPGSYRVKVRKPGYLPWEQEVQITANQRTEVVIDLQLLKPSPKPPVSKPPAEAPEVTLPPKPPVGKPPSEAPEVTLPPKPPAGKPPSEAPEVKLPPKPPAGKPPSEAPEVKSLPPPPVKPEPEKPSRKIIIVAPTP